MRSRHPRLATIGVYGFSVDAFLSSLAATDVRLVVDVRQRRGVRGREYAWANSLRLQSALREAGIAYQHRPDLAPTTELRHLQYAADARAGVGKRTRTLLDPAYIAGYVGGVLDHVDLGAFVKGLPVGGGSALLCVERDPEACHRSLIADRLKQSLGIPVSHLRP